MDCLLVALAVRTGDVGVDINFLLTAQFLYFFSPGSEIPKSSGMLQAMLRSMPLSLS